MIGAALRRLHPGLGVEFRAGRRVDSMKALLAEGYEAVGGRGVSSEASVRVSLLREDPIITIVQFNMAAALVARLHGIIESVLLAGELLHLLVGRVNRPVVDLESGTLRVVATRVVAKGIPVESVPKTAAGIRSIPLDPSLVALFKSHRARQAEERLAAGPAYEDGGYLVADELGRPYHPDTISDWFDDRVKTAGLRRIRLHDTRHTAATLMLASGEQVKVVSEMLGHASPTITLSIYAHVLPGMAEAAGERLSALVLG
jgi:integrase